MAITPAAGICSPPSPTPAPRAEEATASPELPPAELAESNPTGAEAGEAESDEIICVGDSCQSLPAEPEDPTPGTLVPNSGNPPLRIFEPRKQGKKRRKGHHSRRSPTRG
jgi:hypothetical protein